MRPRRDLRRPLAEGDRSAGSDKIGPPTGMMAAEGRHRFAPAFQLIAPDPRYALGDGAQRRLLLVVRREPGMEGGEDACMAAQRGCGRVLCGAVRRELLLLLSILIGPPQRR